MRSESIRIQMHPSQAQCIIEALEEEMTDQVLPEKFNKRTGKGVCPSCFDIYRRLKEKLAWRNKE